MLMNSRSAISLFVQPLATIFRTSVSLFEMSGFVRGALSSFVLTFALFKIVILLVYPINIITHTIADPAMKHRP